LGRLTSNDAGVITERGPDTVRGPDVAFYSYASVPKGERPQPYAAKPPELVFEVRSPSQTWPEVHAKVAEYLTVGVQAICVVDGPTQQVVVHHADRASETLAGDATLTLPAILGDFELPLSQLFE
ncbi:MAG: Uma2 family endonuclease, partial [Planctomycetota bacterium]